MAPTLTLSFRNDGNSDSFVGNGWSKPEDHGRWTNAPEATLTLSPIVPSFKYNITINARPYLHGAHLTKQKLRIYCNDIQSFEAVFTTGQVITFEVPADAVTAARKIVVRLEMPDCAAPASLTQSSDVRKLGFAVASLTVESIGPAQIATKVPLSPPKKIAAVTMVYNEAAYLPIWLKHYRKHVGIENCYVIDHGSTDGSTLGDLGCNIIRIPRSPFDDHKKSSFKSQLCSGLLNWFDWVVSGDVDELLVPDPKISSTLADYVRRPLPEVVTAIGLNVAHRVDMEPEFDFAEAVTPQRRYVFSASSMCKPSLISRPISWAPGAHSANADVIFDHLYLFHLRWFDLAYGLQRLQKTRTMPWARTDGGQHQRVEDDRMTQTLRNFGNQPNVNDVDFDPESGPIKDLIEAVLKSQAGREDRTYKISLDIWGRQLWRLPDRFIGTF